MSTKVNELNAELLGRPLIDRIVEAHSSSNYDLLVQNFPEFSEWLERSIFDEAVHKLSPLGKATSIDYLGMLNKTGECLLLWKVRYENCEEDILWSLYLAEAEVGVKPVGMLFDR